MRKNRCGFVLLFLFALMPAWVYAQTPQQQEIDSQEAIEKAIHLKKLIDNLLLTPNVSSIQKTIKDIQNEKARSSIHRAMEAKALGEKLFDDKKYFEALVDFQTSLECIVQAIRESKIPNEGEREEQRDQIRVKEKLKSNEYFISTAFRILSEDENNATDRSNADGSKKLLEMAKVVRTRAEMKINEGKTKEAMEELENSTSLAKRAIISLRQGKVIERKSPGTPETGKHP